MLASTVSHSSLATSHTSPSPVQIRGLFDGDDILAPDQDSRVPGVDGDQDSVLPGEDKEPHGLIDERIGGVVVAEQVF
jgi:hypothetical protein